MRRMKTVVNAIAVTALLASIVGCGKSEEIGGGSRGIVAGTVARASVYGIRAEKKLRFVMFTDVPSEGTTASGVPKLVGF